MIRMSLLSLTAAAAMFASPSMAQDNASADDAKINQLFVYGDDECPQSSDDEIVVCARLDEGERFRIPKGLRTDENSPKNEAFARKVQAYEYVGADGFQSCTPTGLGGFTGCGLSNIEVGTAEREQDPGKLFGRLIAQKRAERLAGIDAEAEEVEKRVVQFEKDRAEREAREAAQAAGAQVTGGEAAAADAEPLPLPEE